MLPTLVLGWLRWLAGLAGLMAGPIVSVQAGMGEPILILTLVVIVTGGIGSIRGAFYGALIVGIVLLLLQSEGIYNTRLIFPFFKRLIPDLGYAYLPFAVFWLVAWSNAVNLTDGLDGLSGGTMTFAWISYMVIALLNAPGQVNLAIVCALIAGALVGFLWFNVHPASVIIGDAGALGFGAALAVTGLVTGHVLLLPLIGIIFVVETGSVILQVASVKLTGKRIFLFTPIHHHFERLGWAETQITFRFWVIGAIGGILGIVTFLATRGQG